MITLTIKRQDGSVHWTERFNTQTECDAWLARVRALPYWDSSWTWASVDDTPPPPPAPTPEEIAAKQSRIDNLRALVDRVKNADIANMTAAQRTAYLIDERMLLLKTVQMLKASLEWAE